MALRQGRQLSRYHPDWRQAVLSDLNAINGECRTSTVSSNSSVTGSHQPPAFWNRKGFYYSASLDLS